MIIAIGCDICEHQIAEKLDWLRDESLWPRIFSDEEILLLKNKGEIKFISGRFAAKEAVLKCLGTGMEDDLSLADVQIFQNESGKPIIKLQGKALEISDSISIKTWHLTISHTASLSIAFAIAER